MNVQDVLITTAALYLIIAARYFVVAGLFYWLLWRRDPQRVRARRLTTLQADCASYSK